MPDLKRGLARIAAGLFCLSFAGVFLAGLLRGKLAPGSWWAWALLAALVLLWVWRGCRLAGRCTGRTFRLLFWGMAALLLVLILAAGSMLLNDHTVSPFDTEAVYRTALDLALGRIPAEYNDYFVTCENNLFCTLLLAAVYRVVYLAGGPLVPAWGMGLNAVCLWLAALFTALGAKRVWGRAAGLLALLASFFFLPYYIFTPFLYTDPMGAPFVAGAILLAVRLALGRPASGRGFSLLPILCLLGNLCFFLVWECNARYTFVFSCCLFWLLIGALTDLTSQGETT